MSHVGHPDPQVAAFMTYLWPRYTQTDAVGALSRFVRAHAMTKEEIQEDAEFRASIAAGLYSQDTRDAEQTIIDTPGWDATFRWQSIENMRTMAAWYGPNVTAAEFATALAAWQATL